MSGRILIVEDDSHIAEGLRFNLAAEGYQVDVASDGRQAVDRLWT
jgi:DNA-binding response OmpR family regulator